MMNQPNPPQSNPSVPPRAQPDFRRPQGLNGSFDPPVSPAGTHSGTRPGNRRRTPDSLAEAFSRPQDAEGVTLQRAAEDFTGPAGPAGPTSPGERSNSVEEGAAIWSEPADPWRDPSAAASLGNPVSDPEAEPEPEKFSRGPLLSLPEVLFGRRVKPVALALLGVVALAVGAVGGLVGWWIVDTGSGLANAPVIAEADAGKERPLGSVADIAKRAAPAVIKIDVVAAGGQSGETGSGVVIDPQGYVLTNAHVVSLAVKDPQAKINAIFIDGTRVDAKLVGADAKTDLAVIKVVVRNPTVMRIGKSADLEAGDSVIAIGSPLRLANTVTQGIVSAVKRPVSVPGDPGDPVVTYDAIQTDASINPGNSGGALVDSTGALVGINSSIKTSGGDGEGGSIGIGFAIPSDDAIKIAQALIKDGKVRHAEFGVNAVSVVADTESGAKVQNVVAGGAAARAGIAEGDVIIKIGDRMVRDAAELTVAVRAHTVGETVPVQFARQDRVLTVNATLSGD